MISIIICSINKERKKNLAKNIEQTIGCEYEIIAFDNLKHQWGITKVYNHCAQRAKYPILCFLHEDIEFLTPKWGIEISKFMLNNSNCGCVGFAGATAKSKIITDWGHLPHNNRINVGQRRNNVDYFYVKNMENKGYEQVITLDGLCIFTKKEVWEKMPFDEVHVKGFHLYDLDFTLRISLQYHNYVCGNIKLSHFSDGNYNLEWLKATEEFHKRWAKHLPRYVNPITTNSANKDEKILAFKFIKRLIKNGFKLDVINKYISLLRSKKQLTFTELIIIKYKLIFKYKKRDE